MSFIKNVPYNPKKLSLEADPPFEGCKLMNARGGITSGRWNQEAEPVLVDACYRRTPPF